MTDREPDDESVAQGINYILSALDIIAAMALKPEGYDEIVVEEIRLGQIISRTQLILSFIEARRPAAKVVRRVN
jgi:hypothetical protein